MKKRPRGHRIDSMKTIFIVEDHTAIAEGVAQYLRISGYEAHTFPTLSAAGRALEETTPDLIIQDVMLPDGDGFEFIRNLRQTKDIPVIFMTARVAESDRIAGFELGADDYITKPFSPRELVLRVQAVLRRVESPKSDRPVIDFYAGEARLTWDRKQHKVALNGSEVYLTAAEWRILETLLEFAPEQVTRAYILDKCFDYSFESYERIVDTHIKNIRAKLGSENRWIETVRGFGYRFIGYTKD